MEWRRNDRASVLECLQRGEYDAIATTSQGALDELAHLTAGYHGNFPMNQKN